MEQQREHLKGKTRNPFRVVIGLGKNWHPTIDGRGIQLSPDSIKTALAAAHLYHEGAVGKILFSTGNTAGKDSQGIDYPSEALAMFQFVRRYYPQELIPDSDIILEQESFDTAGNAEEVRKLLLRHKIRNPILLSVRHHLRRSRKLFNNYGVYLTEVHASEDVLKRHSDHYEELFRHNHHSLPYIKEYLKELMAIGLQETIDPYGKILRIITRHSRHRHGTE